VKVVILGGYGVFGSRLARLLRRDGHEVWLAGRNPDNARSAAEPIGARPLEVDLTADLAPVFAPAPDVVIDAAGPFQSYEDDPYRIARRCIAEGADYLDLSDDAGFTAGIAVLDGAARSAGRRVISGASSVPGLSSIAVAELSRDMDEILLIDTAILPGNRAPRGASVVASILGKVGKAYPVWRGGQWRQLRCWTDRRRYRLSQGVVRSGYFIEVPDIRLFPKAFGARSVMFRAGLELEVMNAALSILGALRQVMALAATPGRVRFLQRVADLLLPFGTDQGGMRVAVTGSVNAFARQRIWDLFAEAGEGPFVPGIVCRALLRCLTRVPPGARPCIAEVTLSDIEDAMSDLAITTEIREAERPTLFQSALRDRWALLPPEVRELHSVQDVESFSGVAHVMRGRSLIARLAAWFFGFPRAGKDVPITVTKTRTENGEIWERNFDGRVFRSYCTPSPVPYRYRERFWLFNCEQDLPVTDGCMHLPVRRGWFLGLPIPRPLLPGSDSKEYSEKGRFHFDVSLIAPLGGGLVVRYRGALQPDRARRKPPMETTTR
jgi:saccharopine dehydrogenase-like NADP-dependent oxidoreductase